MDSCPSPLSTRPTWHNWNAIGYVSHTVDGRTYVFSATEARPQVAARAVKQIVDWLCNGSIDEVLVGMVDARMLDRRTLQRLAKRIEDAKGGK